METNPLYWDCNCDVNYIHKKSDTLYCNLCDSKEEDCPDSSCEEIEEGKLSG